MRVTADGATDVDGPQLCMQMGMRVRCTCTCNMHMHMTIVRLGLFLQREEPGSEPGNSLWHPEVSLEVAGLCNLFGVLGLRGLHSVSSELIA